MAVAETLALLDGPDVRNALLYEIMEDATPVDLVQTCLRSLRSQRDRLGDSSEGQAFCSALLLAARYANAVGLLKTANELELLALRSHEGGGHSWVLDRDAAEVVPAGHLESLSSALATARLLSADQAPIDSAAVELAKGMQGHAGSDLEKKYRVVGLGRGSHGELTVDFVEGTWTEGRAFHAALRERRKEHSALTAVLGWNDGIFMGRPRIPGLGAVHAVVLTSDNQFLVMQRSRRVSYSPGHWSVSFEEQITAVDFAHGDPIAAAARRGLLEEFGVDMPLTREGLQVLTAFVELETLNIAFVVIVRPGIPFADIHAR